MKKVWSIVLDALFAILLLASAFFLNLLVCNLTESLILSPMIFVLAVFLISLKTKGMFWGIFASVISVFLVNYAFTYPYYGLDLVTPECIASAAVMLFVSIVTGALTTRVKTIQKIQAESEKERMRAGLLRAVSHDLRTPLTTIYGSCCTIIDNYDSLDRRQQLELLTQIQEDSEWLTRMVENLLSITRIDGQQVQLHKTPVVLDELLDSVLLKFYKRCPHQEVRVMLPDSFVSIPMDVTLIEQVLINLLDNAVHHARGMTELLLSVTLQDRTAVFEVRDNGCGIAPEQLRNLFSGSSTPKDLPTDNSRRNMGIGLSACAAIIRAHNGIITGENNHSGGACFRFTLETEENCYESESP